MTNTGLYIYDLLKGTFVRKTMRELKKSQHWSMEELGKLQDKKLKALISSVSENIPFYRESESQGVRESENQGIREDEKRFSNLYSPEFSSSRILEFPVIDRKTVMEAGDALLSDKINLKKCKISRTGGTTGPPLRIYRDRVVRSWSLAAYYRFYSWMGIEPGMREVELWGSTVIQNSKSNVQNSKKNQNLKLKTQNYPRPTSHTPRIGLFDRISNFRSYNAFSFNDNYLEGVVNDIQNFKPKLIRGYLSAIILLAEYIRRNNIHGIHPIAVSCTSETLFPEYRKMIEEVFQAPLFNQYGCGECNSIAFECSEHNGMHISMEHCMLESDENNNLIITNLDNYSQPFIRYMNGDVGIIDESLCSCGNAAPRIIELHGRANENVILKDGSSVNGIFFANLFDQAGYINSSIMLRFQIIQSRVGEILFKAEVKKQMTKKDVKRLKATLMPFFNKVDIEQNHYLDPEPSGKFRYIISEL